MGGERKLHKEIVSVFIFALVLGVVFAVAGSIWATSIGSNISVSGTLGATGATTLSSTLAVTGLMSANGGISMGTQALSGTTGIIDYTNFDVDASGNTTVGGTLGVTGATTFTGTAAVGASGTALTQVKTGYVSCGPNVAAQTILATSTGTLMCSGFTNISQNDAVFMTASSTAAVGNGQITYAGKASTTAANQVQVDVTNLTGATWTVTTTTWRYLIIR